MIYFFRSPLFCFNFCMSNTNKVDYKRFLRTGKPLGLCEGEMTNKDVMSTAFLLSCRLEQRETETSRPYKNVILSKALCRNEESHDTKRKVFSTALLRFRGFLHYGLREGEMTNRRCSAIGDPSLRSG